MDRVSLLSFPEWHPSPVAGFGLAAGAPRRLRVRLDSAGSDGCADCHYVGWPAVSEFRHPVTKAISDGSAGDGVGHWGAQPFSALLLIGLTCWLICALT